MIVCTLEFVLLTPSIIFSVPYITNEVLTVLISYAYTYAKTIQPSTRFTLYSLAERERRERAAAHIQRTVFSSARLKIVPARSRTYITSNASVLMN